MRKLASVRRISNVFPIENADAIEVATVDGWNVVVKKNEFKAGDLACYFEIDSWIAHDLFPHLSKGNEPREYNGVKGERLRTVKLRGQVSQGLLIHLTDVYDYVVKTCSNTRSDVWMTYNLEEGTDLTQLLNIQKWEAPISPQLQGLARGSFPTDLVPKTDQERIQNCFDDLDPDTAWEVTMKLDGSSCTIFRHEDEVRVCSRNLELKMDHSNKDNAFVQIATVLSPVLASLDECEGLAFQGEVMGPNIQGNREKFNQLRYFIFDVYDIKNRRYLDPAARRTLVDKLRKNGDGTIINHVPVIQKTDMTPESVEDALMKVDDLKSINHTIAEGVVYKRIDKPEESFKIISNRFLLKEK